MLHRAFIPDARAWLPEPALDPAVVEPMLAAAVESWSRKWFARRPVRRLGPLRRGPAGRETFAAEIWHRLEDGLSLAVGRRLEIAGAMLDHAVVERTLSPADRAVLDGLAAGCIDDLRQRLCDLLRLPPDAAWQSRETPPAIEPDAWSCLLGQDDGEPLVRLVLSHDLFVGLVKLSARTPAPPLRLRPVAEGLAAQPVAVSAFLGGCQLPLAEIAALVPGDVLVLDRDLDEALELALDDGGRSGGCALHLESGQLLLKLTSPFFG